MTESQERIPCHPAIHAGFTQVVPYCPPCPVPDLGHGRNRGPITVREGLDTWGQADTWYRQW